MRPLGVSPPLSDPRVKCAISEWRSSRSPSHGGRRVRPKRVLDEVSAFQYVTVPNASTYRAVVDVFADAKAHYIVELRPADVLARLGDDAEVASEESLELALEQLVKWGNLQKSHDTARVQRIADFYRKRYLYHLSAVGEAAHAAVSEVEKALGRAGSLQAGMLARIAEALRTLLSAAAASDATALRDVLFDVDAAFGSLTEEANRFIGDLDQHVAGERVEEEQFLLYKRAVLAYLTSFVERLRRSASEIAALVRQADALGFEAVARVASSAAELAPAADGSDPTLSWVAEQVARWSGVRAWFVGDEVGPPRVERLVEVAFQAVLQLARQLGRLNERRIRAADRAADFRVLARWFSECVTDVEAHRLWHLAFGLASARHFHIAEEDPGVSTPSTSWWTCAPVCVPVRLRSHGAVSQAGRAAALPDHSGGRAWIANQRRRERAVAEAALARFVGRGPMLLSSLRGLRGDELIAFLSLLDELMAIGATPGANVQSARTADGRFELSFRRMGDAWAEIETEHGTIRCREAELTVAPVEHATTRIRLGGGA